MERGRRREAPAALDRYRALPYCDCAVEAWGQRAGRAPMHPRSGASLLRRIVGARAGKAALTAAAGRRGLATSASVVLRDRETGAEWVVQPRSAPVAPVAPAALAMLLAPPAAALLSPQAAALAALAPPGALLELCAAVGGPAVELGAAIGPMASEVYAALVAPATAELTAAVAPVVLEATSATAGGQAGAAIAGAVARGLVSR